MNNTARLLDPFSTPEPTPSRESAEWGTMCDFCDNVATREECDPFMEEIRGDDTPVHFCCDNPTCIEKLEEALHESAMEI